MTSRLLLACLGTSTALTLAACGSSGAGGAGTPQADGDTPPAAAPATDGFQVDTKDCLQPDRATQKIEDTLKVGWSGALSGPLANAVGAVIRGMEDRFKIENEAGGIDGVKLQVVSKDDAFNPERAKANVLELIEKDEVDVLDTFGSGQLNAVADDQNANCVPLLFAQASVPDYRDAETFPWTTEYLPAANVEMALVVEQLKKQFPDGAEVALAVNQTESGQGYAKAFKDAVKDSNLEIVKEAPLTDPNAAATTLKASGAQILVDAGVTTDCLSLSQAIGRAGWKPDAVIQPSNCADGKSLFAPAGKAADGQQILAWLKNPNSKIYDADQGMKDYLAAMQKTSNPAPNNSYTVNGWVIGDLMIDTFKKAAKSPDGLSHVGIIKAARSQDYAPPMFIDGIDWKMTPTQSFGILAMEPFKWNAATMTFESLGPVVDISNKYE